MAQEDQLLNAEERVVLEKLSLQNDLEGQRARALIALDDGQSQSAAGDLTGLSKGQVQYILRKFRSQRLLAFPDALALLPAEAEQPIVEKTEGTTSESTLETEPPAASKKRETEIQRLLKDLDNMVNELKASLPEAGQSPYSPLGMIILIRESLHNFTPEVQLDILEQFQGLTREDLMDPDTWKGIAYMIAYSAQFQAMQTKDVLNKRLPEPIRPDTIFQYIRAGLDRIMPEIAKDLASNLEGASREDLLDPDTWKGMVYMIGYSAQFQASQTKDRLNEQLPDPFKPDTILNLFKESLSRLTPDVAKEIVASFEGATKEDLLDLDTWKGVWYMLNYSLQFQAEQIRNRLLGEEEE